MTLKNTGNKALSGITGPDGCATSLAFGKSTTCQVPVNATTQAEFEAIGAAGRPVTVSVTSDQGAKGANSDVATVVYKPGVAVTVVCPKTVSKRECSRGGASGSRRPGRALAVVA